MYLYSLYDCKADGYTPPFLAKNDDMAHRTVVESYRRIGTCQLTEYPEDFTVFRIAEWNEDTGEITPCIKSSIGNVLQIVNAASKAPKPEEE